MLKRSVKSLYIVFLQINEFVKRARAAKIHAHIISHLKKEMPTMMGKAKAQQKLIDNLTDEFGKVSSFSLSPLRVCACTHILASVHHMEHSIRLNLFYTGSKRSSPTSRGFPKCRTF